MACERLEADLGEFRIIFKTQTAGMVNPRYRHHHQRYPQHGLGETEEAGDSAITSVDDESQTVCERKFHSVERKLYLFTVLLFLFVIY